MCVQRKCAASDVLGFSQWNGLGRGGELRSDSDDGWGQSPTRQMQATTLVKTVLSYVVRLQEHPKTPTTPIPTCNRTSCPQMLPTTGGDKWRKAKPQALWKLPQRRVPSTTGNPAGRFTKAGPIHPGPPGPRFSPFPGANWSEKQTRAPHVSTKDLTVAGSTSPLTSLFSPAPPEAPVLGFPPSDTL